MPKINNNYASLVADFNKLQTKREVAKFEDQVVNNYHDGRITRTQYESLDVRITKRLNLSHAVK